MAGHVQKGTTMDSEINVDREILRRFGSVRRFAKFTGNGYFKVYREIKSGRTDWMMRYINAVPQDHAAVTDDEIDTLFWVSRVLVGDVKLFAKIAGVPYQATLDVMNRKRWRKTPIVKSIIESAKRYENGKDIRV